MRLYRRGKSKHWTLSLNFKGKRYVVSTRLVNKTLALEWAHKFEVRLRFGSYLPDEESATFERLCEVIRHHYVVQGRRSSHTLEFVLKRLKEHGFEGVRAIDITTERLERYKAERLRDGAAKSTINVELSALSLMFRLATEQSIVSIRPLIKYLTIGDNARRGFVSWGDYLAIREHLPACLQDLCDFLWWTGLRISTGRQLEWRDVVRDTTHGGSNVEMAGQGGDPSLYHVRSGHSGLPTASIAEWRDVRGLAGVDAGANSRLRFDSERYGASGRQPHSDTQPLGHATLRIRSETTKTAQAHEIPVVGPLAEVIARAAEYRTLKTPLVFHRDGKPLLLKWCEENFKRGAKKVGLEHIIIHDLRRSFVRNMRQAGISEPTIMSMTGHRSRSVFLRYNITDLDEKKNALEGLAEFLQGQSKEPGVRKIR